jgi:hypothetical protein
VLGDALEQSADDGLILDHHHVRDITVKTNSQGQQLYNTANHNPHHRDAFIAAVVVVTATLRVPVCEK